MRQRKRRAVLILGIGTLAGVLFGAAASRSLQASFSAAYRAFRDPGLLEARPPPEPEVAICPPPADGVALDDHLLAREFEPATDEDLDDPEGATLASLAMPDLKVPVTRRTMRYVRLFARSQDGRAVFLQRYRRAAVYRDVVEHALREAGLPEDLLWLAAIESSFDPRAVSPAGAAGLWQFMPHTGAVYGLDQSEWVDERRSLARATTAAAAHLRDLYERFGRWDLALAAYNFGHEGVLRGMEQLAASRDPSDRRPIGLAELAEARLVPEETVNYVPQILAFALVAANRARFGLDQTDLEATRPFQLGELAVPQGTRLRTVARAAGISTALLREYNPQILRDRAPPIGGDYLITLPADRVSRTLATFPAYHDHEILAENEGAAASAPTLPPWLDGAQAGLDGDPLPPRPGSLGRNRVPAFGLPGQTPGPVTFFGAPAAAGTKLPVVAVGGGVGWQQPFDADPLGVLSGRVAPATRLGRRELAIERQLALLSLPGEDEEVERFSLGNGVSVELRRDPSAPLVAVSASVADGGAPRDDAGPRAGARAAAALAEARYTVTVPPRELEVGVEIAAGKLRLLLGEAGAARVAELRREAGAARRQALEKAPYGRAWIALGEALFPAGHPLEGTILGARDEPDAARDLLLAEALLRERSAGRATLAISGNVTRAAIEPILTRALGGVPGAALEGVGPHPRDERILIEDAVPGPRLLYGWIGPGEGEPGEASLRVALEVLTHPRIARLAKALGEAGLATDVHGRVDGGERASVAAIDVAPAAGKEGPDVERRLEAEIEALATTGPTWNEVALAKVLLKAQLEKELAVVTGAAPAPAGVPRPVTAARIRHALSPGVLEQRIRTLDEVSQVTVRGAFQRVFARGHRVVVTTWPRGRSALAAAGTGSASGPR